MKLSPLAQLGLAVLIVFAVLRFAGAAQTPYSAGGAANVDASQSCSYAGAVATKVSITSASATSTIVTGPGGAQLICDVAVHWRQGLSGVTGTTAGTNDTLLPANTAKVLQVKNSYFGIIGTTGSCYLTECQ